MSRWLLSVNSLLERLDGQVENVVEERAANQEDSEILEGGIFESASSAGGSAGGVGGVIGKKDTVLENILAKRGLSFAVDEEEDEEEEKEREPQPTPQPHEVQQLDELQPTTDESNENVSPEVTSIDESTAGEITLPKTTNEDLSNADESNQLSQDHSPLPEDRDGGILQPTKEVPRDDQPTSFKSKEGEEEDTMIEDVELNEVPPSESMEVVPGVADDGSKSASLLPTPGVTDDRKPPATPVNSKIMDDGVVAISGLDYNEYKNAVAQAREAQKEARTLRRHVVTLNSQLENAEAEINAQRNELERAAERMEKDRIRNKEEREKEKARHAEEMKQMKQQHETSLAEHKKRFEQQLEDARQHLRQVEERRMQEGGDWNKELANALEREKEMVRRVASLEDERSTFLSQISTLQAQQEALGNRLESLTQTAENAMERERDAEDRLDAALSVHARQISQRQARETALERTISELGAALAVARDREIQRLKSKSESSDLGGDEGGSPDVTSLLRDRLEAAQHDLETVQGQLTVERQRSEALQKEMRDIAKERADEASAAHARQLHYDRQLADMSVTISRLQLAMRDSKKSSSSDQLGDNEDGVDDDAMAKQIRNLSEEVLRQREKVSSYSSEISALKSRLQVALDRATKAEAALTSSGNGSDLYDVMERSPSSGNGATMRRRGGGGGNNRRSNRDSSYGSIAAAIRLDGSQGKGTERIGKAIDALDSFSVETGKYLRYNRLARGAFILYLLLLHLWTFGLFFFQAHVFEPVHGDFGAGTGFAHGPHAMMLQHNLNIPKVPRDTAAVKQAASDGTKPQGSINPVVAVVKGGDTPRVAVPP